MGDFLEEKLKLNLHPDKVFIKTYSSGIDFLGWVHFSKHRVLRTSTKRRAIKALLESENLNVLRSYSGLLKHGNQFQIKNKIDQKVNLLMQKQTQ
jgi:hypothetical protein